MKLFLNEDECRGAVGIVNFVSGGLECLWRKSEERKDARPDFTCARARTQGRTHARTHARRGARMHARTRTCTGTRAIYYLSRSSRSTLSRVTRISIRRGRSFEPWPTAGLVDDDSEDESDDEEDSHRRQSVHLHVEVRRPSVGVFLFRFRLGLFTCACFSFCFGSKSLSDEDHRQQGKNAEARHLGQES